MCETLWFEGKGLASPTTRRLYQDVVPQRHPHASHSSKYTYSVESLSPLTCNEEECSESPAWAEAILGFGHFSPQSKVFH